MAKVVKSAKFSVQAQQRGAVHGSGTDWRLARLGGKMMRGDAKPDGFLTKGKRHP